MHTKTHFLIPCVMVSLFITLGYSQSAPDSGQTKDSDCLLGRDYCESYNISRVIVGELRQNDTGAITVLHANTFSGFHEQLSSLLRIRLSQKARKSGARSSYDSLLLKFPNSSIILMRAGIADFRLNHSKAAKEKLLKSWELNGNPETGYYLGVIFASKKAYSRSAEFLLRTIVIESESGYWHRLSVKKLRAISRKIKDRETNTMKKAVLLEHENNVKAALELVNSKTFSPKYAVMKTILKARLLENSNNYDSSYTELEKCLKANPGDAILNLKLGILENYRGDLDRGRLCYERSWEANKLPETGYRLGEMHYRGHDNEHAIKYLSAAASIEGKNGFWRIEAEKKLDTLISSQK